MVATDSSDDVINSERSGDDWEHDEAKKQKKFKRESRQKWVLLAVALVLVLTTVTLILYFGINNPGPSREGQTEGRGGLPLTCTLIHNTPLTTVDPTIYFNISTLLSTVAPPQRTGNVRATGALPTGHFASNQINHGPLTPIRQFPHSLLMTDQGVTYEAYTIDRWGREDRQVVFDLLTPGKLGAPWEKRTAFGSQLNQFVSGPDGAPFAAFTGTSGVRIGIKNTGEPVLTDFGEMFANFLYKDASGGTMELPIVRGSAMLTHIFTGANPVISPYCLVAVNGQPVRFDCPEEKSVADKGTAYIQASCSNATDELTLEIHFTKPVLDVTDIQWAATEEARWPTDRAMYTCDDTICSLQDNGHTLYITIPNANGTMLYAVNIIGYFSIPRQNYNGYWVNLPGRAQCTGDGSGGSGDFSWTQFPWFLGSADVSGTCHGARQVEIRGTFTKAVGGLEEIQYIVAKSSTWDGSLPWQTCSPSTCTLSPDGTVVDISMTVTYDDVSFAVNVNGQYMWEAVPFNWRRKPERIRCDGQPVDPIGPTVELTGKSFILELSEPGVTTPNPSTTRKFVAYFSQEMTLTMPGDGGQGALTPSGDGEGLFTGVMQLAYAGTGPKGDFTWARKLDQYAGVYSYKPKTRYCYEGDKGYISFAWNKRGGDFYGQNPKKKMLTMVLPHQETLLAKKNQITTPFGFQAYVGDVWVMKEDLPRASMEPDPEAIKRIKNDPQKLQEIKTAMDEDAAYQTLVANCSRNDQPQVYWAGKSIGMVARLASISRALDTDHYIQLDQSLRTCLELWLGVTEGLTETNSFRYDTVWGGMFIKSAEKDEDVQPSTAFGFVSFGDHHFDLGYWIYAMAYYSTYYKDWAMEKGNYDRMLAVARDVGNPSRADKFFPTVRHKDWYLGSSWASGIQGGYRQEESSSEAINCYHALAALGHALDLPALRAIGQLTLATEIRSTRHYWQVRGNNRHLFPPLLREYGVIGQLREDYIYSYMLNWECEPRTLPQTHACIVGIQLIPIIAVSHLYMDQEWALSVKKVCRWAMDPTSVPNATAVTLHPLYSLDPVTTKWSSFCYSLISKCDAQTQTEAAEYIKSLNTSQLEPGSGLASFLLFIYEST